MRIVARIAAMGAGAGLVAFLCPQCESAISMLIDPNAWENYQTGTPRITPAYKGDDRNH